MTKLLKPCPSCNAAADGAYDPDYVVCSSESCGMFGPNSDPDRAKWNALPRRDDRATAAMSDGELIARAIREMTKQVAEIGICKALNQIGAERRIPQSLADADLDIELNRRTDGRQELAS